MNSHWIENIQTVITGTYRRLLLPAVKIFKKITEFSKTFKRSERCMHGTDDIWNVPQPSSVNRSPMITLSLKSWLFNQLVSQSSNEYGHFLSSFKVARSPQSRRDWRVHGCAFRTLLLKSSQVRTRENTWSQRNRNCTGCVFQSALNKRLSWLRRKLGKRSSWVPARLSSAATPCRNLHSTGKDVLNVQCGSI